MNFDNSCDSTGAASTSIEIKRDFLSAFINLTQKGDPEKWAIETVLESDPKLGCLIWKKRPQEAFFGRPRECLRWNGRYAGKVAGCQMSYSMQSDKTPGEPQRVCITIRFEERWRGHGVHRLMWILHRGPIPDGFEIDHKDRNPWNNKLDNLRLSTHSQNVMNQRVRSDCSTGYTGISPLRNTGKFQAAIMWAGKRKYIGVYPTKELAKEAYDKVAAELHGEFFRLKT